jgi:hypothetical protein
MKSWMYPGSALATLQAERDATGIEENFEGVLKQASQWKLLEHGRCFRVSVRARPKAEPSERDDECEAGKSK